MNTAAPCFTREGVELYHGDCLSVLPGLPAGSVDSVVTDPPYPEVDRPQGRMTEDGWRAMMQTAVKGVRRVLKPGVSAVILLQPNSERVGRMRAWLWEFQAWLCREWGWCRTPTGGTRRPCRPSTPGGPAG